MPQYAEVQSVLDAQADPFAPSVHTELTQNEEAQLLAPEQLLPNETKHESDSQVPDAQSVSIEHIPASDTLQLLDESQVPDAQSVSLAHVPASDTLQILDESQDPEVQSVSIKHAPPLGTLYVLVDASHTRPEGGVEDPVKHESPATVLV